MAGARQGLIVVGVSGSKASLVALSWAAREAIARRVRLQVVRAWRPAWDPAPYATTSGMRTAEEERAAASCELAAIVGAALGPRPAADVSLELVDGAAERTLVDRCARADLLVLGSHAPASAANCSVGPVIRACLSGASCPIVIVTADTRLAEGGPRDGQLSAIGAGTGPAAVPN